MSSYLSMRQDFIALLNRTDCADPSAVLVKGWFDKSIVRIQREVRAPHMERVLDIDTSTADVSEVILPDDWLETKAVLVTLADGCGTELDYLQVGTFYRKKGVTYGTPTYYTRHYDRWLIADPFPEGSSPEVIYFGEEVPLVNDDDETPLAAIAPDLIVYGALTYAADYFTDERGSAWEQKWQFFRDQIQSQSTEGEDSNGSNAIQPTHTFDDGTF